MSYYTSYQDQWGNIYCDQTTTNCIGNFIDQYYRIVCADIRVLNCANCGVISNGLLTCDPTSASWNCGLCANDLPFNIPIGEDDVLDYQFQEIDTLNGLDPNNPIPPVFGQYSWGTGAADVFLKDSCTGNYLEDGLGNPLSLVTYTTNYFVGSYQTTAYNGTVTYQNIQQIQLPFKQIITDFKVQFPNSDTFFLEFAFDLGTTGTYYFYTESYRIVNCKNTVLIEGSYKSKDCNNYFYGGNGNQVYYDTTQGNYFPYSNQIRIPATIERTGFTVSKEFVGTYQRTTGSQLTENYMLYTDRVPERLAIYLANLFSSEKIYINGTEFIMDGDVSKNNDTGSQWFIEANLKRIDCSKTFSC
tara:strand:+ start:1588 stop:2661 length:1074 start_codon:yes stop_codon:yes gene_type:complete